MGVLTPVQRCPRDAAYDRCRRQFSENANAWPALVELCPARAFSEGQSAWQPSEGTRMKSLLPIGLIGLVCLAASSAATGCGSRQPGFTGGAGGSDDASLGPEGDDSGSLLSSPGQGSP